MGLAEDLLEQAEHLVVLDKKRPKQVNLRRAVSSAYYALFHLLIAESVRQFVPYGPLMDRVSRAYQHGEMKEVCEQVKREPTPEKYGTLFGKEASDNLRTVANAFLQLQERRHAADYDVALRLSRFEADTLVRTAREAFVAMKKISGTHEAKVFGAALAFAKRWDRNR